MGLEGFAADLVAALIGWITEKTADKVVDGTQRLALGDGEVRALRRVVGNSVNDTVAWTGLDDKQAAHLLATLIGREPGIR